MFDFTYFNKEELTNEIFDVINASQDFSEKEKISERERIERIFQSNKLYIVSDFEFEKHNILERKDALQKRLKEIESGKTEKFYLFKEGQYAQKYYIPYGREDILKELIKISNEYNKDREQYISIKVVDYLVSEMDEFDFSGYLIDDIDKIEENYI